MDTRTPGGAETLTPLFNPRSVAVIGASSREYTIGNRIIRNLLDMNYSGAVYPVNPKDAEILGKTVYPSVGEIPGPVDLVHIVLKNTLVPGILTQCGEKGVKFCIINTAGFRESGPEGIALEETVVGIAREYGIRLIGPNCQGIINADPAVNAYCNFTFTRQKPGAISIFAQSGGVGEVINNRLCELDEGLRMYVSSGNSCDIRCEDVISYWADDPGTRAIICHVETMADPEGFLRTAEAVSRKKPLLLILPGYTDEGAAAARFHTGGDPSNLSPEGTNAPMPAGNLLFFRGIEEACQAARAFVHLPLPRGNRASVITNTGGAGVICADELIRGGCTLPLPEAEAARELSEILFPEATISNPMDVLATAGPGEYEKALSIMLQCDNVDSVLLNFITPFFVDCDDVARRTVALAKESDKPVVCVIMTDRNLWKDTLAIFREGNVPVYSTPEEGARALAALTRHAVAGT